MNKHMQLLRVSENRRYLTQADGTPFFWLGDTAWELFHKLSIEEAEHYLIHRAEQKFNVVQAVALAELDGLTTGNAYGRIPLLQNEKGQYDPTLPDLTGSYSYWDHVDRVIDLAASLGLYIALLPTWGDKINSLWGKDPVIFNPSNARIFGKWLGERYRDKKNIVWVLGGDRPLDTIQHFDVINAMATGIREGDKGTHLMSFHPKGGQSSSHHVHEESWLDFNMIQSSHGDGPRTNYLKVQKDYLKEPTKPTLDAEPCYEDHPRGFNPENGYFDEVDVRQAAYYSVFSGSFGHTYGHHSIWCMCIGQYKNTEFSEPGDYFIMHWLDALSKNGAIQMQHLRTLIESKSMFDRIPDQSLLMENYTGSNYMVATRSKRYIMVYFPNGLQVNIVMGKIKGKQVLVSWFCPRSGVITADKKVDNLGIKSFRPPTSGRGQDWVLLLDSVEGVEHK